jgi:hypothetical protein
MADNPSGMLQFPYCITCFVFFVLGRCGSLFGGYPDLGIRWNLILHVTYNSGLKTLNNPACANTEWSVDHAGPCYAHSLTDPFWSSREVQLIITVSHTVAQRLLVMLWQGGIPDIHRHHKIIEGKCPGVFWAKGSDDEILR